MNKQEQKEIIRSLQRKYRQNYASTLIYLPKTVKAEVDAYCKEKGIVKTTWISHMVITEMQRVLHKKYDEIGKKFV